MAAILDNGYFNLIVSIFTIYALFGDDFRILVTSKGADNVFNGILMVCMVIFIFEIFLSVKVVKGYFNSFFFWLDVISTVTLVLDLTWVSDAILASGGSSVGQSASIARASRASRIGTKAGRIVRIIRLIRLVKIFKIVQQKRKTEAIKNKDNKIDENEMQKQQRDLQKQEQEQMQQVESAQKQRQSKVIKSKMSQLLEKKQKADMDKIY